MITNDTATTDDGKYNVCQLSGFRAKPGELVRRWDGLMVLPKFIEPRHSQDRVRGHADEISGSLRPEKTDQFTETLYPNGVQASDL